MHVDLQQNRAIHRKGNDVAALHAVFAGLDTVLQIEASVGRLVGCGQGLQHLLGGGQRQLGVNRVVFRRRFLRPNANARHFGHENQFVGLQCGGDRRGHFFHGQVESFTGGRKTKWRHQQQRAHVQHAADAGDVDLAHQA